MTKQSEALLSSAPGDSLSQLVAVCHSVSDLKFKITFISWNHTLGSEGEVLRDQLF